MSTYDMLRAHYATRSDDELKVLGSAPDLPPEAKRALADEIAQRGMDPELRRQATIAALFVAMEQEKAESLRKSRRTLQTGVAIGLVCLAIIVFYFLRTAFPRAFGHGGILLLAIAAIAVVAVVALRRRSRAGAKEFKPTEPPTA
jgi:hypothetical protein